MALLYGSNLKQVKLFVHDPCPCYSKLTCTQLLHEKYPSEVLAQRYCIILVHGNQYDSFIYSDQKIVGKTRLDG